MKSDTNYFYLNLANEWPGFAPGDRSQIEIESDGSLRLARADSDMFAQRGVFLGGPFEAFSELIPWYRLRVYADPLPESTHVQLFTLTADQDTIAFDPTADEPFPKPDWHAAPRDLLDILIPNSPARRLWIGGLLHSDGRASPALHQMRVHYGRDTWLKFLPALYAKGESQRDLMERFLSLHESMLGSHEEAIADLPLLFDPYATPEGEFPSWLSWLAAWLAFDLNEAWSGQEARENLAQAFQLYGKRGTLEGLRRYLKLYAGVEARIEEPGLYTTLWTLGENSTLGFTTMLAPAHPQGAVAGTTATLDESHVTRDNDFGAALFEDLAHRFCVKVYCAELTRPSSLDDARTVIDREKPAHSTYELCLVEPRMRVGVQSRVGVDAIVAQGPPAAGIGIPLGTGTLANHSVTCETASSKLPAGATPCESTEEI
jgi:phage tail-like protein